MGLRCWRWDLLNRCPLLGYRTPFRWEFLASVGGFSLEVMTQSEHDTYLDAISDRELTVSQSTSRAVLLLGGLLLLNLLSPLILILIWAYTFFVPEIVVGFLGLMMGLVISEYAAIWLWLRSFASNASKRIVLGNVLSFASTVTCFLLPAIFYSWGGLDPIESTLGMLLGVAFYWVQGIAISLMIYPMNLFLGKSSRSNKSRRQFSIRFLLVSMIAAAILSLVGKGVVQAIRQADSISNPLALETLGYSAFWMVWTIPWHTLISSLQLGCRFSRYYRYYNTAWWITIVLGPALCALSGSLMYGYLTWQDSMPSTRGILFFYTVAVGHVLGLSMVIDLLPSQRALDQQET